MKLAIQAAILFAAGLTLTCLVGCAGMSHSGATATKISFGAMPDGTAVDLCILRNSKGAEARIARRASPMKSSPSKGPTARQDKRLYEAFAVQITAHSPAASFGKSQ